MPVKRIRFDLPDSDGGAVVEANMGEVPSRRLTDLSALLCAPASAFTFASPAVDPYVPLLNPALAMVEGRQYTFDPPCVPEELALAMPLVIKGQGPSPILVEDSDHGKGEEVGEDEEDEEGEGTLPALTASPVIQATRARLAESIERERRASHASFLVLSGGKDLSMALQTPQPGSARRGGPSPLSQALSPPTAAHAADLGEKVVRAIADDAGFIDRLRAELLAGTL